MSKTTHTILEDTQSSLTDKGQLTLERPVFNDAHGSLESSQIFQGFPNLAFPALTFLTILSLSHGIWSTLQPMNVLSFLKHPITCFLFPSGSFCMERSFHTLLCNRCALPMRSGPTSCLCFPPLCFCTPLYALYPNTASHTVPVFLLQPQHKAVKRGLRLVLGCLPRTEHSVWPTVDTNNYLLNKMRE